MKKHYESSNQNCERAYLYGTPMCSGIGSQFNNMLLNYVSAIIEERAFVLQDDFLSYAGYRCSEKPEEGSYSSCFKSFVVGPPSCDITHLRALANGNQSDIPQWECTVTKAGVYHYSSSPVVKSPHGFEPQRNFHEEREFLELLPIKVADHEYRYFDVHAYALKQLWNLRDDVQEKVDELTKGLKLDGTVCGFHVRRGDKAMEARRLDVKDYLSMAKTLDLQCDTCYFASDNIRGVMAEVEEIIPQYFPSTKTQFIDIAPVSEEGHEWYIFSHR